MTLRYLLDTTIVSAPVSKTPDPGILQRINQNGLECAIAAPVGMSSLMAVTGCRKANAGWLSKLIHNVVRRSLPILPYDEVAATWHGRERARLEALGRPAPYVDGQIAAIAHVNELVLVTANTKDFASFKDLAVQNWSRR